MGMSASPPHSGTHTHDDPLYSTEPVRIAEGIRALAVSPRIDGTLAFDMRSLDRHAAIAGAVRERLEGLDDVSLHAVLLLLLDDPGGIFQGWTIALPEAVFGTKRAESLLANAEDGARIADAMLHRIRQGPTYEHGYGVLARSISRAVSAVTEADTQLIETVSALVLYMYGEAAKAQRAERFGVASNQVLSWLWSLWERTPRLVGELFDRLASGGLLADDLAVSWAGSEEDRARGAALLLLLLDARKAEPGARWLDRWAALRAQFQPRRLRDMLLRLAENGNAKIRRWGAPQAGDPAMLVARGALWALGDFPNTATREFLAETTLAWARSTEGNPALGNAAIWALARPADQEAIQRLLELRSVISHKVLRARLDAAIASLARATDLSPDELVDRQVPDHGLDVQGERAWIVDGYRVTLRIGPGGAVEREILAPDGRVRKGLPSGVRQTHPEMWPAISRETKELKATISVQRARLEDAMISGRYWTASVWHETVGGHPVLAPLGRRLVWQIDLPATERPLYARPTGDGWRDDAGEPLDVPDTARLSIAHPLSMPDAVQERWQRSIVGERIVQPFKQLFRETYVVTPVEREAPYTSARFAGFPVSLRQIYALAKSRGWSGPLGQTFFDGAGTGYREFAGYHVRAVLKHSADPRAVVAVETVHFEQNAARPGARRKAWTRIRLADVPPIAFSEAMRDIDLIVSVAAIGTESQWREWEAAREAGRVTWPAQRAAYEGSLAETSESRAALLRTLIHPLGVDDRVEIEGRFAFVRGERGRYRIHLGTGNIHVEPAGRYLCIVPVPERDRLFLPFEEDDKKTSEIISKIVLLAHDSSIRDPSILAQLPQREKE